jgi:dedicator of cytokinesis protein 3
MPVTFPESYPFSLIARLPSTSPADKRDSLSSREGTLFNAGLGETAIVILVLATSALKTDLHNSLTSTFDVEGKEHTTHLLNQIFQVATSILDNNAFPANWLNVNILAHVALIRLMDPIADILETYYIPTDDADGPLNGELWRMAISTLLKLLSSEQLVIEDLSPQVGVLYPV